MMDPREKNGQFPTPFKRKGNSHPMEHHGTWIRLTNSVNIASSRAGSKPPTAANRYLRPDGPAQLDRPSPKLLEQRPKSEMAFPRVALQSIPHAKDDDPRSSKVSFYLHVARGSVKSRDRVFTTYW